MRPLLAYLGAVRVWIRKGIRCLILLSQGVPYLQLGIGFARLHRYRDMSAPAGATPSNEILETGPSRDVIFLVGDKTSVETKFTWRWAKDK